MKFLMLCNLVVVGMGMVLFVVCDYNDNNCNIFELEFELVMLIYEVIIENISVV